MTEATEITSYKGYVNGMSPLSLDTISLMFLFGKNTLGNDWILI